MKDDKIVFENLNQICPPSHGRATKDVRVEEAFVGARGPGKTVMEHDRVKRDSKDLRIDALAYIAEELTRRIEVAIELCGDATPGSCAHDCYLLFKVGQVLCGVDEDSLTTKEEHDAR
jgi:hypothetical protein